MRTASLPRLALLAMPFLLAACSETAEKSPEPQETAIPVEPDGGIGDGAEPPGEVANAGIPVTFLGAWDYVEGTCHPASDLRLDIGEHEIEFYEALGKVTNIRDEDGTTYVDLAMTGEGESWNLTLGLRLVDAGTTLMVIDPQAPDAAEEFLRKRCDV